MPTAAPTSKSSMLTAAPTSKSSMLTAAPTAKSSMPTAALTSSVTDEAAATPPSQLSDQELVMLESTLRVQLQVAKYVRVAQVTSAVGITVLSGALAAVPSGFTIVASQVQRVKLKRRHRHVAREMAARHGLTPIVRDARPLGKRAYAMSMATGMACCVLACSADMLIDCAVAQVVSEVVMNSVDEFAMGSLTTHVTKQLTASAAAKPTHQEKSLKATRSWGGFMFPRRKLKKAETMPPDLFGESTPDLFGERELNLSGEREPDLFGERALAIPQHVEVHRSNEFAAYGECLVLRFTTIVPGEEQPEAMASPTPRRRRRTTIVGEPDALSEAHWLSLWTLEDGPKDVVELRYDGCDHDGTEEPHDGNDFDLFGGSKGSDRHDSSQTSDQDDWDLFGASDCSAVTEECYEYESLFGKPQEYPRATKTN